MNTVPRPSGAPNPSEADALRALLAEIREALDVPIDGMDPEDRHLLLTARAAAARGAVMLADTGPANRADGVADATDWLRSYVAEHAPLPARTEDGAQ